MTGLLEPVLSELGARTERVTEPGLGTHLVAGAAGTAPGKGAAGRPPGHGVRPRLCGKAPLSY
ncbi:MAG: hypothetical protein ACLTYN_09585 [Dysosmobacter welbionis]